MTLDPIICSCYDIHRRTIATAIREKGYRTVDQINKEFFLDKACGNCKDEVREVLKASQRQLIVEINEKISSIFFPSQVQWEQEFNLVLPLLLGDLFVFLLSKEPIK